MNRLELRTAVIRALSSANPTVDYSVADVNTLLDEAYEHLSDISECHETTYTLTCDGSLVYNLWTLSGIDPLTVRAVRDPTIGRWLEPLSVRELDGQHRQWERVTASALYWFIRGLYHFGTYPRPLSGTLTIYHTAIAPAMSSDSAEPIFPKEFHKGLVEYVLFEMLADNRENEKASLHYGRYLEVIIQLANWKNSRMSRDRMEVMGG